MNKEKLFRSAISLMLTLLLLIGTVTIAASAKESEEDHIFHGTFRYYDDRTEDFYFSDGYFKSSGKEQNVHLRTMSAAVTFTTERLTGEDNKLLDLLTDTGFDPATIAYQDMDVANADTIGTVIAQKDIDGTPLVLVSIRAIGYGGEWASNFTLGTEGDAQGFREAADKVLGRIEAYLNQYDLSNAKLWICGYSRSGAVANLVGREINKDPEAYNTTDDDLFVYTFEAPACSADDTVYANIHNVADSNDLAVYVYPEQWGLHLNGVTETIGDPEATIMTKKLNIFADGYNEDYKEVKISDFLQQFSDYLFTHVSREQYVSELQGPFIGLSNIIFSKSWDEQMELIEYLKNVGTTISNSEELSSVLFSMLSSDPASEENIAQLTEFLTSCMNEARANMQTSLTDEEFEMITAFVGAMVRVLAPMIKDDSKYSEKNENGKKVSVPFYHLLNFGMYIKDFVMPHIHFNFVEYLKAEDSYYDEDFKVTPGNIYYDKVYTYDDMGEELFSKAIELGFSRHDVYMLRNGYDLRIEAQVAPHEYDYNIAMECTGVLPKSRNFYGLYDIKVVKVVGFSTYSCDQPAVASISIRDDIADYTKVFSVARKLNETETDPDNFNRSAVPVQCKRVVDPDGTTRVLFEVKGSSIYCIANGDLTKEKIDAEPGDVDKDMDITSVDATHIQRHLAYLEEFTEVQEALADVDEDGEVSVVDVTHIQRYLAFMPSALDD